MPSIFPRAMFRSTVILAGLTTLSLLRLPAVQAQSSHDVGVYIQQATSSLRTGASEDEANALQESLALLLALGRSPYAGDVSSSDGGGTLAQPGRNASGANITILGNDNFTFIDQAGERNLANVYANGDLNQTWVRQYGNNNLAQIRFTGDGNVLDLTQNGDGHRFRLTWDANRFGPYDQTVIQNGANNEVTQLGVGAMPIGIEQHGDGMHIIIMHH